MQILDITLRLEGVEDLSVVKGCLIDVSDYPTQQLLRKKFHYIPQAFFLYSHVHCALQSTANSFNNSTVYSTCNITQQYCA